MQIQKLKRALKFTMIKFLARSGKKNYCGAEVIGGEVMILPTDYLRQAVDAIRHIVGSKVEKVDVGCQSNHTHQWLNSCIAINKPCID
jgi:hypothetical protein